MLAVSCPVTSVHRNHRHTTNTTTTTMRYADVIFATTILSTLCLSAGRRPGPSGTPSGGLKDYYHNYFPIGVAVSTRSITGPDTALILREFNSVTPENAMK